MGVFLQCDINTVNVGSTLLFVSYVKKIHYYNYITIYVDVVAVESKAMFKKIS